MNSHSSSPKEHNVPVNVVSLPRLESRTSVHSVGASSGSASSLSSPSLPYNLRSRPDPVMRRSNSSGKSDIHGNPLRGASGKETKSIARSASGSSKYTSQPRPQMVVRHRSSRKPKRMSVRPSCASLPSLPQRRPSPKKDNTQNVHPPQRKPTKESIFRRNISDTNASRPLRVPSEDPQDHPAAPVDRSSRTSRRSPSSNFFELNVSFSSRISKISSLTGSFHSLAGSSIRSSSVHGMYPLLKNSSSSQGRRLACSEGRIVTDPSSHGRIDTRWSDTTVSSRPKHTDRQHQDLKEMAANPYCPDQDNSCFHHLGDSINHVDFIPRKPHRENGSSSEEGLLPTVEGDPDASGATLRSDPLVGNHTRSSLVNYATCSSSNSVCHPTTFYQSRRPSVTQELQFREMHRDQNSKLRGHPAKSHKRPTTAKSPPLVEVYPGVHFPLRGTQETLQAIAHGYVVRAVCFGCHSDDLYCIADALCVLCPTCRSVNPVVLDLDHHADYQFGAALGFTHYTWRKLQKETVPRDHE